MDGYKRVIQSAMPKISIKIDSVSRLSYPNMSENIVVVNFEQDFKSTSLQNKMLKQHYWINEKN